MHLQPFCAEKNISNFGKKITQQISFGISDTIILYNSYQSRTNGPINAHLTIAQVMSKYNHNNEKQEALL